MLEVGALSRSLTIVLFQSGLSCSWPDPALVMPVASPAPGGPLPRPLTAVALSAALRGLLGPAAEELVAAEAPPW